MTIETTDNDSGARTVSMTECPICGEQVANDRWRVSHLADHELSEWGLE